VGVSTPKQLHSAIGSIVSFSVSIAERGGLKLLE